MIIYTENIPSIPNFVGEEERVLKFWQENRIFEKSLEKNKNDSSFVFYDGPPFANGLPHYGHLLTSCVKDTVGRFQTMLGNFVARRFGWDCHGLPAEMAAEKDLKVSGRKAIEEYGIGKFNDYCKSAVMEYSGEWRKYIDRIGRWVDMENAYKTMDIDFMESIFWAFKNLYDKGLVYEEMRVMPYSWACQTPLSNFETRLDNAYRQKESKSVVVKFELKALPKSIKADKGYILVWTTTPWTLPSNLAIAVNQNLEYEFIVYDNIAYIASNVKNYLKELGVIENKEDAEKIETLKISGSEFIGITYKPLFNFFKDKVSKTAFTIYHGDCVTADAGTAVLHISPGFGEDDFELCKQNKIGIRIVDEKTKSEHLAPAVPVDESGKFTFEVPNWEGIQVFEANDEIIKALKINGNWVKTEQYLHQYPHCWRTDTPIIYKAMPSFYIRVSQARERLCELNQKINWIPESVKDGLFGNWLKEARDWSISRNRFFGTPIPVWKSTDSRYPCIKVFGSIKELEDFFGDYYSQTHNGEKLIIKDLHRQFIDELIVPNPNDPTGQSFLKRIPDVFDCWFESGSMSFAEVHYPFNEDTYEGNLSHTDQNFDSKINYPKRLPADFIVEYTAQTRGWFYTLMVLSTLIFDKIPFRNCICHGVILDEKGQKLSKRLQNYIDPIEAMNQYGADALRFVMLSSPVMSGGELLIDKEGKMLQEALRLIHQPIWSAIRFFTMYAKEDKPNLKLIDLSTINTEINNYNNSKGGLDDYFILSRIKHSYHKIHQVLINYNISDAYKEIRDFIDDLNNCYIRWNRDRFWGAENNDSKANAYNTLYTALYNFSIIIAPLLPFLAENLFQILRNEYTQSVHLESINNKYLITQARNEGKMTKNALAVQMLELLKTIDHLTGSLRDDKLKIRRRQPLREIKIFTNELKSLDSQQIIKQVEEKIKEITNCKEAQLIFIPEDEYEKYSDYFTRELKLESRSLGKKYGKKLKDLQAALSSKDYKIIDPFHIEIGGCTLCSDELSQEFFWDIKLNEKYQNTSSVYSKNGEFVVVILNSTLDEELVAEGIVRDVIRAIQEARKKHLHISDRIELNLYSDESKVIEACKKFQNKIIEETLVKTNKHLHTILCDNLMDEKFIELTRNINQGADDMLFGYQVEDAKEKKSYDLRLIYRKI